MENTELIEICRKIYKQHRVALDLIFENKPDELTEIKDIMAAELQSHQNIRNIEDKRYKNWIIFRTNLISQLLDDSMYGFYIMLEKGQNKKAGKVLADFYFFLESSDVPPEYFTHMKNLTSIFKPNDTKEKYTQKSLMHYTYSIDLYADNIEEQTKNIVDIITNYCADIDSRIKNSEPYKGVDFSVS